MSWKSGGSNLEKTNNIFVNRLSANYFTLKNDYEGHLTINGTFLVHGPSAFRSNVTVGGNLSVNANVAASGSLFVGNSAQINKSLSVLENATVDGNVLIKGNLRIMQNYTIDKLLFVNGNSIHLSNANTNSPSLYNVNLVASGSNLGINLTTPATYGFDLLSSGRQALRVISSQDTCSSILAQSGVSGNNSVAASSSADRSQISFYNYNDNNNSANTGSVSNSISGLDFASNRALQLYAPQINLGENHRGSVCTIYGNINASSSSSSSSSALTLLPESSVANAISMQVRASTGQGLAVWGGRDKVTQQKSVATLGLLYGGAYEKKKSMDVQTMVAGSQSNAKTKFTLGINTANPSIDQYILDVNGPMKLGHEEVSLVYESTEQVNKIIFGTKPSCRHVGIILATLDVSDHAIEYTTDAGNTWQKSVFDVLSTNANIDLKIRCGVVFDKKTAFLGGDFGLLFYTIDGFQTWHRISGMLFSSTISSLCAFTKNNTIIVCFVYGLNTLGYFTVPSLTTLGNVINNAFILSLPDGNTVNQFNDNRSFFYGNKPNVSSNTPNQQILDMIYDEATDLLTVVGADAIHTLSVNVATTSNIFTYTSDFISGTYVATVANTNIADITKKGTANVGNNILTMYGHVVRLDFDDIILQSVYIHGSNTAIAVGKKGAIYVTVDAGLTWTSRTLSSSVSVSAITSDLLTVTMTDDNTVLIMYRDNATSVSASESASDSATSTFLATAAIYPYKIAKCHVPELFNHGNYTVLTVTGNSLVVGSSQTENMNVIKSVNVGENAAIGGNVTVIRSVTANAIYSRTLEGIGETALIMGNTDVHGFANIDLCNINANLSVRGTARIDTIRSLTGNLSLGKNGSIRILENSFGNPNDVFLGNSTDNVMIRGNNLVIQGGISSIQNKILLRANATDANGSAGAGIYIRDNQDDLSGYIRINSSLDGYEFKASSTKDNLFNIRTNELRIDDGRLDTITGLPIKMGLLVLQSTPILYGDNDRNGSTMTSAPFDVQNIIVGNYAAHTSGQTINTNLYISGTSIIEKNTDAHSYTGNSAALQVSGGAQIQKNMFVGGNLYSSRSFLEQVALSRGTVIRDQFDVLGPASFANNATFSANTTFATGGTSFFLGNLDCGGGGGAVFRGKVAMTGNVSVSGNLAALALASLRTLIVEQDSVFSGNVACAETLRVNKTENISALITNKVADTMGAVQILGGVAVKKDTSIRGTSLLCMDNIVQMIPLSVTLGAATIVRDRSPTAYQSKTFVALSMGEYQYQNGTYVISSSTLSVRENYDKTFDESPTILPHWTGSGYLESSNGQYTQSLSQTQLDGDSVLGEFLQIQFPYASILYSYSLVPERADLYGTPFSWILCASNDGNAFTTLSTVSLTDIFSVTSHVIEHKKYKSYSFYRLILTKVKFSLSTLSNFALKQVLLYGFVSTAAEKALLCAGDATFFGNTALCGVTTVKSSSIATNSSSGAMIVSGDMGVSGNAYISNLVAEKGLRVLGNTILNGSLQLGGSLEVLGKYSFDVMKIDGNVAATSLATGTLIIPGGGASVGGNVYVGQNTVVFGNSRVDRDLTVAGNILALSDIAVTGNVVVARALYGNVLSDNIIIGSTGKFTCNGQFVVRSFAVTSNVESTSTTTGAMQIVGGMGITESIYVGKNITSLGSITANEGIVGKKDITSFGNIIADIGLLSAFVRTTKLDVTGTSTASANIAGGMQVFGNTILSHAIATNLFLQSSATTTSIDSGSLIVKGGGGITGNCHIGGSMIIYGGLSSNSQSTTWTYPIIRYPVTSTTTNITNNAILSDSSSFSSDLILFTLVTPSTVQSGLFSFNFGGSNPSRCQLTWMRITNLSSLLSYKNGPYVCLTSVPAYSQNNITYYGSNVLRSNNMPWISTYTYDNIMGFPSTTDRDLIYITNLIGDESYYLGEFIALELPYRIRMSKYTIRFRSFAVGSLVIESYPIEWILVGRKANDIRLHQIDKQGSVVLSATDDLRSYTISSNIDTSVFIFFALVITQVKPLSPSGSGLCVTGLYQVSFEGEPSIPVTASNSSASGTTATTTTTTTYNQNLIGPTSFSGASTTITFGDATTYGNVNVFKDLNIVGSIYCPLGTLTVNSNVIVKDKVTAATFSTTSDYRIKSNVASLTESYTVDRFNPVSYYNKLTGRDDIGLLAHELQELYPALVYGQKDDVEYQSINYASIISILVREVKELKKIINGQK